MFVATVVFDVFSACAEVVPAVGDALAGFLRILRVRGGSSATLTQVFEFPKYSPRARRYSWHKSKSG